MTVFYLNLSAVFFFSFLARCNASQIASSSVYGKPNKYFALLAMTTLVLVSGLRNNVGDTYFYMHSYEHFPVKWSEIDFNGDFGFNILQMLLQQFTNNPQILLFTTALFTNVLIVSTLYQHSRLFEISLYVYITLGYYLTSMNGIRQYLAAAILFAATRFIIECDWKRYFLVVIFAATIHQTALIMIPIYYIVRLRAWSKMTFVLLMGAVVIIIGFNEFMSILFTAIEDTKYAGYQEFQEGGANIIRVAVSAVPVLLAYVGKERLKEIMPNSNIIVNMSIMSLIFMLISTQNWIFARFSIYFGLYSLILVAWIIKIFRMKDQKLIYFSILLFYFIYFLFEHVLALNMEYKSNYITF